MIEVRGPNVFKGYWRMPEKTEAEIRPDGFFITGDLGKVDERGYVHIVGRGKDLIITGGYNVYPKEIETELDAIPGVSCPEPLGAFYAYPSVTGLIGKSFDGVRPQSSGELATLILEKAEVAVVPGEAFGTPGYVRLSYALGDADLEKGVRRLADLLAEAG